MSLMRYRALLDAMGDDEIIWLPYDSPNVHQLIPDYCFNSPEIWRASVPLMCFHIIEWHHPDRVMRQFGRQQPIPIAPVNLGNYHTIQLRGRTTSNWVEEYSTFIAAWERWRHAVVDAPLAHQVFDRTSEYMQWYWRRTRRWIHPSSAATGYTADILEDLRRLSINYPPEMSNIDFRERVTQDTSNVLHAMREHHRSTLVPEPAPPSVELPRPQIPQDRPSRRRGGYLSTRPPVATENVGEQARAFTSTTSTPFAAPPSSSHYMPPSSFAPFSSPNADQFGSFSSLLEDPALFTAQYNTSTFDYGGPSNEGFVTPRQSISLVESPWFDLNTSTIAPANESSDSQHEQDIQQERPRRARRRARCGTGSHYV